MRGGICWALDRMHVADEASLSLPASEYSAWWGSYRPHELESEFVDKMMGLADLAKSKRLKLTAWQPNLLNMIAREWPAAVRRVERLLDRAIQSAKPRSELILSHEFEETFAGLVLRHRVDSVRGSPAKPHEYFLTATTLIEPLADESSLGGLRRLCGIAANYYNDNGTHFYLDEECEGDARVLRCIPSYIGAAPNYCSWRCQSPKLGHQHTHRIFLVSRDEDVHQAISLAIGESENLHQLRSAAQLADVGEIYNHDIVIVDQPTWRAVSLELTRLSRRRVVVRRPSKKNAKQMCLAFTDRRPTTIVVCDRALTVGGLPTLVVDWGVDLDNFRKILKEVAENTALNKCGDWDQHAPSLFRNKAALGVRDQQHLRRIEVCIEKLIEQRLKALDEGDATRHSRIDVNLLCDATAMSRSSLERLLKRAGTTPALAINAAVLDCACELLSEGVAVKRARELLGFGDADYFRRMFKERFGHTPSAQRARKFASGA